MQVVNNIHPSHLDVRWQVLLVEPFGAWLVRSSSPFICGLYAQVIKWEIPNFLQISVFTYNN